MGTTYINPGLAINKNSAGDGTPALAFRIILATWFQQSAPGVPMPGRLAADQFAVTGKANMSFDVTGGGAILTRPGQGAYPVAANATVNVTTDAANGTNPRIDRIYLFQPDPVIDGATTDVRAYVTVAVGAPAATPTLPTIPVGALELARVTIPANATRTDNLTLTNIAPVTGLSVGTPSGKAAARAAAGISSGTAAPDNGMGDPGDIYLQKI